MGWFGLLTTFYLFFSPFRTEMSLTLSDACPVVVCWEQITCFFSFMGGFTDGGLYPGLVRSGAHPEPPESRI